MPERRLLYLTQHQLLAFRWQHGALAAEGEFVAEAAADVFARYLAEHASSLFTLVVNLGEEGFHSDVIPYLQARDRAIVIARRLGQTFLGAPLAVAISHGYESGSRKNERLLLTALTSIGQLEPWLTAMQLAGTRLQGVYSLPLLSESLLHRLGLKIARGILVTVQDNTVRQSFFDGGHLLFSRVAPLAGSSISDIALSIASEANRFQQYLLSQRMVARGDRLSAHIIAHPQATPAIRAARFNDGIEASVHDILAAGKKIGLKSMPADNRAQALFLHCAISAPPHQQFATPALRQPYRLWQIGNAIRAAGALAFGAALIFSVKLFIDTQRANEQSAQLLAQAAAMEQSYRQALGRLPPMPMSNDVLRQLVDRFEKLRQTSESPARALNHLAAALDATPQIELQNLDWLAPGAAKENAAGAGSAAPPGSAAPNNETLKVKGSLNLGAQGSPRQLIATLDEFTRRLRDGAPGATVTILQTPVDLNASRALKSSDSATATKTPRPFTLQIEYPVPR